MNDRDWGIAYLIIALAATFIMALIRYEHQDSSRYEAARAEYDKTKTIEGATRLGPYAVGAEVKTYRDDWRGEQNLEIQRAVARWTFVLMLATSLGVILLGATLWLTVFTERYAFQALEVARKHGELELQSYLDVTSIAIVPDEKQAEAALLTKPEKRWDDLNDVVSDNAFVRIFVENIGKIPATDVIADVFVELAARDLRWPVDPLNAAISVLAPARARGDGVPMPFEISTALRDILRTDPTITLNDIYVVGHIQIDYVDEFTRTRFDAPPREIVYRFDGKFTDAQLRRIAIHSSTG